MISWLIFHPRPTGDLVAGARRPAHLFHGADAEGVDVCAVSPDGTGLTRVPFDGSSLNPSDSPGGTKVVFARFMDDGSRDLFSMNSDGAGVTQLHPSCRANGLPSVGTRHLRSRTHVPTGTRPGCKPRGQVVDDVHYAAACRSGVSVVPLALPVVTIAGRA